MSKYTITLTRGQLAVVQQALDLYYRCHMGQWTEVAHVCFNSPRERTTPEAKDISRSLLDLASEVWTGLPRGASFGIASDKIADDARVACDIYKTIRHHLWKDRPEDKRLGYTVDAYDDSPMSDEPKPTVRTEP